jgi:membrane-associated protease RseP (regulator of RpoE activity)
MMKKTLIGLGIALAVFAGCSLSLMAGAMAGGIIGYLSGRQAAPVVMPRLWQESVPPRGPRPEEPEPQVQPPEPWELAPEEMPRPFMWELNAALITEVEPGDPADEAGVEAGDIIIGVDDKVMDEDDDLSELVRRHEPGDEIVLTLLRRGEETEIKEIEVTLGRGRDEQGEVIPRLGIKYQRIRALMPIMPGARDPWD